MSVPSPPPPELVARLHAFAERDALYVEGERVGAVRLLQVKTDDEGLVLVVQSLGHEGFPDAFEGRDAGETPFPLTAPWDALWLHDEGEAWFSQHIRWRLFFAPDLVATTVGFARLLTDPNPAHRSHVLQQYIGHRRA